MDRRKLLWRLSNCPKLWLTKACSAYATRTKVPFPALTVVLSRLIRERHPSGRCEIPVVIPFIISIFKEFERRHIRSVASRRKSLELLEMSLVLYRPCAWLVFDGPLGIPPELQSFVPEIGSLFSSFSMPLRRLEYSPGPACITEILMSITG
jgi:hypothetical protein